jgi:nitrogen regulatory protein P-II 1
VSEAALVRVAAIVKPFKLEELKAALDEVGVRGMTVYDVKGFGKQMGRAELYAGAEYAVDFLPKAKVELVVRDDMLQRVTHAILESCRTGRIGDGKIFVTEIADAVRIRTAERGEDALG